MQNHRIYVGTIGEGVFRSIDAGQTFTRAMDGGLFVEGFVRALVVHPRDDRVLYLGTEAGLYRSGNGADDWQRVDSPLNDQQIWSILIPPTQPDTLFVGVRPSRIYRSTDAGRSWIECKTNFVQECSRIIYTRVTTLKADPNDERTLWAGVEIDGIHRSSDGGATWQRYSGTGLVSQDIHDLALWRSNGTKTILAATNADLHRSTDDGRTWQPLGMKHFLPWSYCRSLALPLGEPGSVLLGAGNGPPGSEGVVAHADRLHLHWQATAFPGQANSTIWNFAVHRADPRLIYASSVSGQVYRSVDGGATWEKQAREIREIRALAWTP